MAYKITKRGCGANNNSIVRTSPWQCVVRWQRAESRIIGNDACVVSGTKGQATPRRGQARAWCPEQKARPRPAEDRPTPRTIKIPTKHAPHCTHPHRNPHDTALPSCTLNTERTTPPYTAATHHPVPKLSKPQGNCSRGACIDPTPPAPYRMYTKSLHNPRRTPRDYICSNLWPQMITLK